MRTWHDKMELLELVTKARVEARDTVPRSGGNDAIEAAMFIAMMHALDQWAGQPAEIMPVADPPEEHPALPPPEIVPGEDPPGGEEDDAPTLPEVNYDGTG